MRASDTSIQSTCEDASTCKKYAVQKGYWKDSFVGQMVSGMMQRKQPEISRGYFARTEAIWQTLHNFIRIAQNNCQIISLGAGLDTTFWRLHEASSLPKQYVEVDFPDIVTKKMRCISSKPALRSCLVDISSSQDPVSLHSKAYHLISADLRDVAQLDKFLLTCNLDFSLPTLVLTECVLIYMEPEQSESLIKYVAEKFTKPAFLNYEQLNMEDSFGKVMVANLKVRQCYLAGASVCTTKRSQEDRFLTAGFSQAWCRDMWSVYHRIADRKRIETIELFDEVELLQQLLEHYCLVVAIKDSCGIDMNDFSALR